MSEEVKNSKTISELFSQAKLFKIPPYQRAYSWEEKHFAQFIADLEEFSGRDYYLGHFLLEAKKQDSRYFILDGQQRLTTIILFFKACQELKKDNKFKEKYILSKKEECILEIIDSDNNFFKDILSLGEKYLEDVKIDRKSQKKLKDAYEYFVKIVKNFDEVKVNSLISLVENSKISVATVDTREVSNQVFMFHNSRGKSLTNLDKLKSVLIKNIYYKFEKKEIDKNINTLDRIYSQIFDINYEIANLSFTQNEDNILTYFFIIFYKHEYKQSIKIEEKEKTFRDNNIFSTGESIIIFAEKLLDFYKNFASLIKDSKTNNKIANILYFNQSVSTYCILMALYKYNTLVLSPQELEKAYKIIEITYFRMDFANFRINSNYFSDRAYYICNDKESKEDFFKSIEKYMKNSFTGDAGSERLLKAFNLAFADKSQYDFYNAKHAVKFLLWKYENHLKYENDPKAILLFYEDFSDNNKYFDTIEHIYPQTDTNITKKLKKADKYLIHDLGNLLSLSSRSNSNYRNLSPEEKYDTETTFWVPFISHNKLREDIKKHKESNTSWRVNAIQTRGQELRDFVKLYFDVNYNKTL